MHYESPKIIQESADWVREPIRVSKKELSELIHDLQGVLLTLDESIADYTKKLAEGRRAMLWPKDVEKGLTEMDRKIRNDADVAPIERDLIFMKKIEVLLKDRIRLAMILLEDTTRK